MFESSVPMFSYFMTIGDIYTCFINYLDSENRQEERVMTYSNASGQDLNCVLNLFSQAACGCNSSSLRTRKRKLLH